MGFVLAFSPCIRCQRIFGYNPKFVPSTRLVTGTKEPVCQDCMTIINRIRIDIGMEPFIIHPEAYEPLPEEEL